MDRLVRQPWSFRTPPLVAVLVDPRDRDALETCMTFCRTALREPNRRERTGLKVALVLS